MSGTESVPLPSFSLLADELDHRLSEQLVATLAHALGLTEDEVSRRASEAIAQTLQAHLRELHQRCVRAEQLATVGQLCASAAHELRNPLSVIETSAFILAECGRSDERIARHTRRIADQVTLASGVVSDLLNTARGRLPLGTNVDIGPIARAVVAQVPCPSAATVVLDLPTELPKALADERKIRQVLINLVANALEAIEGRGKITLSAYVESSYVIVAVTDTGPGIAPEHVERLFEPFFTTKAHGTGLGLALAREIARAHGGNLRARNEPCGGARFEVCLPIAPSAAQDPQEPRP